MRVEKSRLGIELSEALQAVGTGRAQRAIEPFDVRVCLDDRVRDQLLASGPRVLRRMKRRAE